MGETFIIIISVLIGLIAGSLIIFYLLRSKAPKDDKALLMLQNQLNEITRTLDL